MDALFHHSTECDPTGVVTVDDLFHHSTECDSTGLVTLNDLLNYSTKDEPNVLATVDDFILPRLITHWFGNSGLLFLPFYGM